MSSNKPAKPTAGSGASYNVRGPTANEQQPKTSGKKRKEEYRPRFHGQLLSNDRLKFIFVVYNRYRYRERPLTREEVSRMMKLEYDKGDTKGNLESLFDKLDDPQNPFTEKYEKESKEDEADLLAEAGDVFRNLLESDGEIHDMAKNLDGLKKRLPRLDARPRPRWAGKYLRWDQLFLLYTLANWCKDDNGDVLSADYAYKVAEHGLFEGVKSTNSIFMILKLPKRAVTSALAEAMGDEEIALFCMNKADAMHRKYIAEERFAESRIDIPIENDDIAVVSQAMQSSGITATTSGQEQSGKGKSREVRERSSRSASPATRTAREGYRRRSPIEPTVFAFDPTGDDCPSEGDDLGKDWE